MTIEIESTATVAKGFSVKREKREDDEVVIAHLRFTDLFVGRDEIDEFCRQPIGWSQQCLFDEQGAPRLRVVLGLPAGNWQMTGSLSGAGDEPRLALMVATLDNVEITLTKLGGLMSGQLSWQAAGDEIEDIADLLGKEVSARFGITDGGQDDLFRAAKDFKDAVAKSGGGSLTFPGGKIEIPAKA